MPKVPVNLTDPMNADRVKIQLCTRGDDAGCCLAANRAVAQAARFGILKNLSIMVPGPTFDDAARTLIDIKGISFGLHVTLNAEWPRTKWGPVLPPDKVPALVESSGCFTQDPGILHDRGAPVEQMIAEIQAQLDKARRAGLPIDYIDEHMEVGWVGGLRDQLARLAEKEGLCYPRAVRSLPRLEAPIENPLDQLAARLKAAPPGAYVLITHPMYDDSDAQAMLEGVADKDQILADRDADRQFWLQPRLADVLRDGGAVPSKYINLP